MATKADYEMDPEMLKRLGIDPAPFRKGAALVRPTTNPDDALLNKKGPLTAAEMARLSQILDARKEKEFEEFTSPAKKFKSGGAVKRGWGIARGG